MLSYQEQNDVKIRIQDRGPGIRAKELPYIFDRFYRADSSRSKYGVSGYGLGLAIAKNIIELHQGTITAKSKPGDGSTFNIAIPVVT